MSIKDKISQMFIINVTGDSLTKETQLLMDNYPVGGFVFLGSNISSKENLSKFILDLQTSSEIELFTAVDQEGGTVQRLWWDEARYVSQWQVGIMNTEEYSYSIAEIHSNALIEVGLNMNLAPILDICSEKHPFLDTRCYGNDYNIVIHNATGAIKAYQDANVLSTAKHFPGHGIVNDDSHIGLPISSMSYEEINETHLEPFRVASNLDIPFIMTSHILNTEVDSTYPASLSYKWQTEILRNEIGYKNLIISDDMNMGALNSYEDKHLLAIQAGTNIILTVEDYETIKLVIDNLVNNVEEESIDSKLINTSVQNILRIKCEYKIIEECR